VVSYGGKTIPRWRTATILKIDISPYLSEKSLDFHEILYTTAYFELDERHVALVPNEKVALDRLRVRQNVFLVWYKFAPVSDFYKIKREGGCARSVPSPKFHRSHSKNVALQPPKSQKR